MLNKIKRTDIQRNSHYRITLSLHPVISSILEMKCICTVQSVEKGYIPLSILACYQCDVQKKKQFGKEFKMGLILTLLVTCQLLFSSIQYAGVPIYFWSQSSSFYSQVAAALQLNFNPSVLLDSYLEYSHNYSWQASALLFFL